MLSCNNTIQCKAVLQTLYLLLLALILTTPTYFAYNYILAPHTLVPLAWYKIFALECILLAHSLIPQLKLKN